MNKDEEEENEKSIYNYNMIFNRINNYDEDIKFNTNLISDIDLQNFDPERYEYYTNLLYIYNKDPKTLYDLLNKYYNVKSMHKKEKGIIKYIYDYARKLRDAEGDETATPLSADPPLGGSGGGGSMRRQNKRRSNRQAGGVKDEKTWQNTFINILKNKMPNKEKMPDKVEKKKEATPDASANEEEDDGLYYTEKEGFGDLSKKIKSLEEEIEKIKDKNNPSLGSLLYERIFKKSKNKEIVDEMEKLKNIDEKIEDFKKELEDLKKSNAANTQDVKIEKLKKTIKRLQGEKITFETKLTDKLDITQDELNRQSLTMDYVLQMLDDLNREKENISPITPQQPVLIVAAPQPPQAPPQASQQAQQPATIIAAHVKDTPEPLSESLEELKDLASVLATGLRMSGGAGNSDEQLKMKYLDNNKYKDKISWKELRKLKSDLKTQPENIDENNKIARLSQDIDNYNLSGKTKEDDKYIIQQLNNFENDPNNPLDELAITFDDRLVFIIATFFIRYITIIIVQWCIDINIIKTFYEGFIYYAIIYIIIFWFVVLFINIDNGYDVKYMNFNGIINSIRTLFYYFYMGTNGISRLLVHTSLIIILIIIPIILNIKRKADYVDDEQTETEKILNNEERKQLSKSLSLFTMFIWLFTSIIATKF
jgi:hypothetical protein